MPNLQFPVLDGVVPTFADISVKCALSTGPLFEMNDIKAINTGGAVDIGMQKSGGRVIYRGTGDVDHTSSLTLYRLGWQKMLRNLTKVAPRRGSKSLITLVHFDLIVQHTPPGSIEIYEYRVNGCRLAGFDVNGAEGSDIDTVDLPLSVAEIVHVVDGQEAVLG